MDENKKHTMKIPMAVVYVCLLLIFSNPILSIIAILVAIPLFFKKISQNNIKTKISSDGEYKFISVEYTTNGENELASAPSRSDDNKEISEDDMFENNKPKKLDKKKKYLQIALNNDLNDAEQIISNIPTSERIIIEAGTPLIKRYGLEAIQRIRELSPSSYIVADSKVADLAGREVEMMSDAGASAITCLGVAPVETINIFLDKCEEYDVESMIDMMNVEDPIFLLKKLKRIPDVVIVHRGVDETNNKTAKMIPYYQIKQIKGNYNIMVSIAGGDSEKEIGSAIFNGANIVVLWKKFFQSDSAVKELTEGFLKIIK